MATHPLQPTGPMRAPDIALLLLLSMLWGASYLFIRVGVATIAPLTLIAARTLIAGLLLWAWMAWRGVQLPRDAPTWRRLGVQAVLNSVLPYALIAWAEQSVPAALATILNSVSPVFAFLFTWLLGSRGPMPWRSLVGVVLGLVGICAVVGESAWRGFGEQVLPQLALVLASCFYGAAALYGRSFQRLPPVVPAAGSLLMGAVVLVPLSLVVDRPWVLRPSAESVAALLGLAVFSTALAFVIYFRLLRTLGSLGATTQAYLRVPMGVGLSVVFLGETLAPSAWVGLACVVAGVAAMTLQWPTVKKAPSD